MKNILRIGAALTAGMMLCVISCCKGAAGDATPDRPNVILIMADDMGYEILGCNGGSSYSTPNLDKLAGEGVRFTNCYANTICSPTRVTLMTGRYNHRNFTEFGSLSPDEPTFGDMMKDAGYVTAIVGKWQMGLHTPLEAGFDEYYLKVKSNHDGYADPIVYSSVSPEPRQMFGEYGPDLFWEYISDFLERNKDNDFFLYYPMFLTHFYFSPTPDSPEWETGDRRMTADKHLIPGPMNQRFFTDMVAYADKNIGRIVNKLEELGVRENTVILFLGDNGTERSIISRFGDVEIQGEKGSLTGAGTHVPGIFNWPEAIKEPIVSDIPVVPADFFATIADLSGAEPRKPTGDGILDGISFLPVLDGDTENLREWGIVEYVLENRGSMYLGNEGRYVTDGRWKLYDRGITLRGQEYFRAGQLINLENDPFEKSPILVEYDTPESAEKRKEAQAYLDKHPVPERLLGH